MSVYDGCHDADLKHIGDCFLSATGKMIPSAFLAEATEWLNGGMNAELVCFAIAQSADKGNPAKYAAACLRSWYSEGIKTTADYNAKHGGGGSKAHVKYDYTLEGDELPF